MRTIAKGPEPASLTEHRAGEHCNYGNYAGKDDLREALVRDQRGLCCYCMARILATPTAMKIEHWRCQSQHQDLELAYQNLLAACPGGHGQPEELQHCDTRKGERDLKFNPADPQDRIEKRIRFEADGAIASRDPEFNMQLNAVLGLNLKLLKNRRKGVLAGLLDWWHGYHTRHHRRPPRDVLERKRDKWNVRQGTLEPFAQVAVWWLDEKLAGAGA